MARLAFMTMGELREPYGHPTVQGFFDRIADVFADVETSDGFIDRSRRDTMLDQHGWGEVVCPKCFQPVDDLLMLPSTLSLWTDLESVIAYAYRGPHGEAMSKRREWFKDRNAPTYVAWWVADGHTPDWNEAGDRIDHLHENGSTAFAFDFKAPFDADGRPMEIDKAKINAKRALNASRGG
ncbi:MAG: DUF3291 domain-containing protein [Armatimonadetes bacterium]|nr:DUF3291 domain-containing protein [Armatimonadota bacterium]